MKDIKVSIIVPVYNVEEYCEECFESLLKQKLNDIEIIIVNDGSTDNSGNIAKKYAEKHPNIFRYYKKQNSGLSDTRNYAIPLAKGEYISFIDSDDYIHPDMLYDMWYLAKKNNSEIAECELMKVWSSKKKRVSLKKKYDSIKDYMLSARVCACNKIYKTDWLKETDIKFPKGLLYEDICFFYKITPFLKNIPSTIHKPYYYYRQRSGSIINSSNKRILDIHKIFNEIFNFYSRNNFNDNYYNVIEYKYSRTLLKSYLLRMLRMKDKDISNSCINESWSFLHALCPNWKNNPYLKSISITNLYLKLISPNLIKIFQKIIK